MPKIPNEKYLSDEAKTALCELLCNEIQVYKELIRGAINLNDDDVDESMEELRRTCPREAMDDTCLHERPGFCERIEDKNGYLAAIPPPPYSK